MFTKKKFLTLIVDVSFRIQPVRSVHATQIRRTLAMSRLDLKPFSNISAANYKIRESNGCATQIGSMWKDLENHQKSKNNIILAIDKNKTWIKKNYGKKGKMQVIEPRAWRYDRTTKFYDNFITQRLVE